MAARAALLSFAGTALTAALTGVGVYAVFRLLPFGKIGWAESMLIGCVLCSTDAASVFNILRTRRLNLRYRTSSLLEMESGSNDPVSYMLTVVFVTVLGARAGVSEAIGGWQIVGMLCAQVGFGAVAGIAFGFLASLSCKNFPLYGAGWNHLCHRLALVAYAVPSVLPGLWAGNGYLSVYLCGILLGNAHIPQKRDAVRFFDVLTGVAQMVIFFLLGLLATPEWLIRPEVLLPALLIFVFLTLIARPAAVSALLLPFRARANQIFVISWAGLRGVASVVSPCMRSARYLCRTISFPSSSASSCCP